MHRQQQARTRKQIAHAALHHLLALAHERTAERVTCTECLKEIPAHDAGVIEHPASDYGIERYDQKGSDRSETAEE